jgi:hypothetical protein
MERTRRPGLRGIVHAIASLLTVCIAATGTASAQSASEIVSAFCDNVLFSAAIDSLFAIVFIVFLIYGMVQLVAAMKRLNDPNQKGSGKDELANGGTTMMGALLVPSMYIILGLFLPDCFELTGAGISALSGSGSSAILVPTGAIEVVAWTALIPVNTRLARYRSGSTDEDE